MSVFKVSRAPDDRVDYDEFDSFICVALSESAARRTHPRSDRTPRVWCESTGAWHWFDPESGEVEDERDTYHGWTEDIDSLVVECIGTSFPDSKVGVILASFNAG